VDGLAARGSLGAQSLAQHGYCGLSRADTAHSGRADTRESSAAQSVAAVTAVVTAAVATSHLCHSGAREAACTR